jgi:decaprenyl-phosphate phosphoribosyltransferase
MSLLPLHRAGLPVGRAPAAGTGAGPSGRLRDPVVALVQLCRPRQWVKNVLVVAAPAAGHVLLRPDALARTGLAFVAFSATASAVYCINDVIDAPTDRRHPDKCRRPVADGRIGARTALALAAGLVIAAGLVAAVVGPIFGGVVAGYLALSLLYAILLKTVPVLEVLSVACGFVLRALGGAAAVHLPPSTWFLMVALFGALFLVTGKRQAEQRRQDQEHTRTVLAAYPAGWLAQLVTVALTGATIAYCQWAFQMTGRDISHPLLALSVVPFLAGLLRYSLLISTGHSESPERVLTTDRALLAAGGAWVGIVFTAIYLT